MIDIFADDFKLPVDKPQTLANRLAIITGCTRGIGLAITIHLASLGCSVLGTYNTCESAAERLGQILPPRTFYALPAPIGTPATSIAAITAALTKNFPGCAVNIVINNAAHSTLASLQNEDEASLVATFTSNCIFPALLIQALLPHLARDGSARIVNVSSEGSHLGRPNTTAYSSSKAALESMTRTWAIELGKEYGGLTANAVVLGLVDTDLWRALPEGRRKYWEGVLMERNAVNGRIGNVKDVAGVVGWLVSSEAAWVSGQCLAVGGGGLMIG